jgi:hypothetical protein
MMGIRWYGRSEAIPCRLESGRGFGSVKFPDEEVDKIRCIVMGGIMTENFQER